MKKLGKLKLNQLRDSNLSKNEMDILIGGNGLCSCSCAYNGYGASTNDTNEANYQSGYQSTTSCGCAYSGDGGSNSSDNHSANYSL